MSVFWLIPPMVLGGTAAAAGSALINATGNLGGGVGPSVMGWLRDVTGAYTGGLLVLAGALIAEAALVVTLKLPARLPNYPISQLPDLTAAHMSASTRTPSLKPRWRVSSVRSPG
jgi:ACS family tartrate transporter-like MFS transporter